MGRYNLNEQRKYGNTLADIKGYLETEIVAVFMHQK
jgi:hypothetical protein